jgi:PAS domain S-box-containing protein
MRSRAHVQSDVVMKLDAGGGASAINELQSASPETERIEHESGWEPSRQQMRFYQQSPELQKIYDAAPIGLAFLSPDCRYLEINQRMTEICGIPVEEHVGRSVRETVPAVAEQVESIVKTILRTGEPIIGIEVSGQRADKLNIEHFWNTSWRPLKGTDGTIVGVIVVAEDVTERKRAETALAARDKSLQESEARFRELADSMSQFAWSADPLGNRYWFNKRWYEYSGSTFAEMQGWGWTKLHHPQHIDRVVGHIRESLRAGDPWEDTFPLRGRDGNYRWFLSQPVPIHNEAGDLIRWVGTDTDVTEQIEAKNALQEINESLKKRINKKTQERNQIWNVCQDLLVICDLQGKYLDVNPAWAATLGWSKSDLLGKTSEWLTDADEREKVRVETRSLAAGNRTSRFELHFRAKDGCRRLLSWEAVPHQGRIYAMARDVTEQRRAEDALQESRQKLAQVARETTLGTMTASIAHEIRQPLSAIVTSANAGLRWLTKTEPNLEKAKNALERVVEAGHRAAEIVTSIRAMFRKDHHEKVKLNVNDLVREILALAHGELVKQKILLDTVLSEGLPQITGDRVQRQQVLLNLVMNAIEAMGSVEDRRRTLVLSSRAHEKHILITVADSGTGIDPEEIDRVFEPFFTTKRDGMGMGLPVCRSIMEAHNGRLWASHGASHGSIFHVQLPFDDANDLPKM